MHANNVVIFKPMRTMLFFLPSTESKLTETILSDELWKKLEKAWSFFKIVSFHNENVTDILQRP